MQISIKQIQNKIKTTLTTLCLKAMLLWKLGRYYDVLINTYFGQDLTYRSRFQLGAELKQS